MFQSNGRGFARAISPRGAASSNRLRGLLVGTALGGSLAVLAAGAPTQANAACSGPNDAVVCAAGPYPSITYFGVTDPLNLTLASGVIVNGVVHVASSADIHFSAEPGALIDSPINGLGLTTTHGSIVVDSQSVTAAQSGITALALTGTVTIHSTFAEAAGDALLPATILGNGFAGVVIEAVDTVASGDSSHAILGLSDSGTVSIVSTGEVSNDGAITGVGIGGVGRHGVTIDSNIIRTDGGYAYALLDLPLLDVELDEFVSSVGIHGRSYEGDVAITSNDIGTLGDGALGIFARARQGNVTIESTKIATQGDGATGILVNAAEDVSITSAEITTAGEGPLDVDRPVLLDGELVRAAGILARSSNGSVDITSDSIHTAGVSATGISGAGSAGVTINSGSVETEGESAIGILATSHNQVSVTSGTVKTSGFVSTGISALGQTGVTIDSGSVATAGDYNFGIFAQSGAGPVSITSDSITTTGDAGGGLSAIATGDVTVDSGLISTSGAAIQLADPPFGAGGVATYAPGGMYVWSGAGDVNITSDDVSTLAYAGIGINAEATLGELTIDSGEVSTAGDGATGILAKAAGAVSITSQSAATEGDTVKHAGRIGVGVPVIVDNGLVFADAIHATSTGDAVTITSGAASASGLAARGIDARTNSGAITIEAGLTTTSGDGAVVDGILFEDVLYGVVRMADAVHAESVSGDIAITSDEAHATGASSAAIYANTQSGSIEISSGTATGVTGGVAGFASNGTVDIDSGSVEVLGQADAILANGVHAVGYNGVTVKSQSVVTHSYQSFGVFGSAGNGAVDIQSGVVATSGAVGVGIGGFGEGDVTIDSLAITTTGEAIAFTDTDGLTYLTYPSAGLLGHSRTGGVTVTSGSISTQGDLAFALLGQAVEGAVTIQSGEVATNGDGAAGIIGIGAADVSITSASASTSGDSIWVTGELGLGFVESLYADEIASADAIHAVSTSGAVSITSGAASTSGLGAQAIHAEASGDISILAGDTAAVGGGLSIGDDTRLSHAIFAVSTGGDIDVEVTGDVSSAEASGIYADASAGTVAIAVASGASVSGALGAIHVAGEGATIVNAGSITATGEGPAIQLTAGADTVTLQNGSAITGAVLGGEGSDVAHLSGSSATATQAQTLAHFVEFEQLNVNGGYWTASGAHESAFDSVVIAAGGGLEVRDHLVGDEYESALATGAVVNNGLLALNLTGGAADTEGLSVTGTGVVRLVGSGTINLTSDTIAHTGGTIIDAGKLLLTTGALQGDVQINEGGTFQIGDGGTVGTFAGDIVDNGTLIFNRSDAYEFTGALSGSGSLVKMGDSQLFLSGDYGFTGVTTVLGGTLKLANVNPDAELEVGGGELDLSGGDHEVAGLSGDGGEVDINEGSLTINVSGTDTFGGEITGDGEVVVSGGGTLNLTGDNSYTGDTQIQDGTLKVNGSIVSNVFIEEGGTLGGNGAVADVDVGAGGTIGAGNSIGLLNVVGDLTFAAGSFHEVEVNAAGQSDKIVVSGEIVIEGGTVEVLAETGTYNRLTTYEILTAAGGIDGEFDEVTTNFAYLTPSLDYTTNEVLLTLARNDIAFSTLAGGANQAAAADAVEAGEEGELYDAVLFLSDAGAQEAFTSLSGEFYGASTTALLAQSRYSREATLDRLRSAEGGPGVWAAAYGAHQTWDGGDSHAAARNNLGGVMLGADMGVGAWRVGAAIGQERSRTSARALSSRSETETMTVAGYGGFGLGGLAARVGVSHAMHDVEADRDVVFPNFMDVVAADFDGTTTQLYGEVGYKMPLVGGTLEPFANLALTRVKTDAFTETGGAGALEVGESEREVVFSSVGARFTIEAQLPVGVASPYISLAYGNASGDTDGASSHAFDTGQGFAVTGASLNDNAALLDTGFDWRISDTAEAGFGYQGSFGDEADEQSVRVEFSLKF